MPYINPADRQQYEDLKGMIEQYEIMTKGDLEYLVTLLMKQYMSTREKRYTTLHDVVYAVQHASYEYGRLTLDKREDAAREENGDV